MHRFIDRIWSKSDVCFIEVKNSAGFEKESIVLYAIDKTRSYRKLRDGSDQREYSGGRPYLIVSVNRYSERRRLDFTFDLLIATSFGNKTRGVIIRIVVYRLHERYESLLYVDSPEVRWGVMLFRYSVYYSRHLWPSITENILLVGL